MVQKSFSQLIVNNLYIMIFIYFPGRIEENGFEVAPGERGGDAGRRGRGRGEQLVEIEHLSLIDILHAWLTTLHCFRKPFYILVNSNIVWCLRCYCACIGDGASNIYLCLQAFRILPHSTCVECA